MIEQSTNYINPQALAECFAQIFVNTLQNNSNTHAQTNIAASNDSSSLSCDSLPTLLSVKDIDRLGITKNNYYTIVKEHPELVVEIKERKFLHRDRFLQWIDLGGDKIK